MKRILYIGAVVLISLLLGYVFVNKTKSLVKHDVYDIVLPQDIASIERGVFDNMSQTLFLSTKNSDDTCGVWSYSDEFTELLRIEDSVCHSAHIFLIHNGVLYMSINAPARLYRSHDNGKNWEIVLEKTDVFWSMARENNTIYGTLWSHDRPAIYRSEDNGLTWNEWINFHDIITSSTEKYDESELPRMRHLHDIVIVDDDIFVGTGDVMREALRSQDDGKTWERVWGEGFTAHIVDNNTIIFGADHINRYGIALFDFETETTTDVWIPDGTSWQGYIYSMLKKDDVYYAATHLENNSDVSSYGILYSSDGFHWNVWHQYKSDNFETQLYVLEGSKNKIYMIHNGQLGYMFL